MQRSLRLSLSLTGVAALALASTPIQPVAAQEEDVFFSQVAAGLEAESDTWNFNAYALVPIGDVEKRLKPLQRWCS